MIKRLFCLIFLFLYQSSCLASYTQYKFPDIPWYHRYMQKNVLLTSGVGLLAAFGGWRFWKAWSEKNRELAQLKQEKLEKSKKKQQKIENDIIALAFKNFPSDQKIQDIIEYFKDWIENFNQQRNILFRKLDTLENDCKNLKKFDYEKNTENIISSLDLLKQFPENAEEIKDDLESFWDQKNEKFNDLRNQVNNIYDSFFKFQIYNPDLLLNFKGENGEVEKFSGYDLYQYVKNKKLFIKRDDIYAKYKNETGVPVEKLRMIVQGNELDYFVDSDNLHKLNNLIHVVIKSNN